MKNLKINKKTALFSDKTSGIGLEILKYFDKDFFIKTQVVNISKKKFIRNFLYKTLQFKRIILNMSLVICLLVLTNTYGYNNANFKETNRSFIYNIIRNDAIIGQIEIIQNISGDSIVYSIDSDIKVKFFLKFYVVGKEKYIYKNGTLIYASLFRMLNNKVKTNHSIQYNKGEYSLKTPEKISALNIEVIRCNLMILYINEPIGIKSVFCDNQQEMVNVIPIGKGIYKVELSKGKYNIFHYKNGRCIKIEAVSPLYDVTLIPV